MSHTRNRSVRTILKGLDKDREKRTGVKDDKYYKKIKPKRCYFNTYEVEKAFKYRETNPELAKELLEEYMMKYPYDGNALTYYASILISLGQYEEAEKALDTCEKMMSRSRFFQTNKDRHDYIMCNIVRTRYKLLGQQLRVQELIQLYEDPKNMEYLSDVSKDVIFYFRVLAGKVEPIRKPYHPYLHRQTLDWQEEDFLRHIKKHMADYNQNNREISLSFFAPDFPLERVYEEVKKYIPSKTRYSLGFYEDLYVFKYDECGRDNNRLTNYFKVVTFHDTDHFITMYPSNFCDSLPCIDLNYLKEKEIDPPKVLGMSQTEKFNRRLQLKDSKRRKK